MKPEIVAIACVFVFFIVLETIFTQFFSKKNQKQEDYLIEIVSSVALILLTKPFIFFCGTYLAKLVVPDAAGMLSSWHFLAVFALFLVFDDLTQYWWHRLSHTVDWLYKLHYSHHSAEYLSVRVVYRNNFFYYWLMPGIWFSGILVYLGGGWVYAFYLVIKMTVIIGAHSDVRWDEPLNRIRWFSPVMWVLERTISTPATHSAHHGKYSKDSATNHQGNFGNLLFLWDILFGTAKITRRYPKKIGTENLQKTSVGEQLFWPVVRVSK